MSAVGLSVVKVKKLTDPLGNSAVSINLHSQSGLSYFPHYQSLSFALQLHHRDRRTAVAIARIWLSHSHAIQLNDKRVGFRISLLINKMIVRNPLSITKIEIAWHGESTHLEPKCKGTGLMATEPKKFAVSWPPFAPFFTFCSKQGVQVQGPVIAKRHAY